jgi:hypothetical protein
MRGMSLVERSKSNTRPYLHEDIYFIEIMGYGIDVYHTSYVLMGEVSEQRNLSQSPLRKLDLVEDPSHQLDSDRFAGYLVCGRATEMTQEPSGGGRWKGDLVHT